MALRTTARQSTLYKANAEISLKPQYWYLSATDRPGSSNAIQVVGESDVTSIEDIHVITERAGPVREGISDLQGRRLNSEPSEGGYIENGIIETSCSPTDSINLKRNRRKSKKKNMEIFALLQIFHTFAPRKAKWLLARSI